MRARLARVGLVAVGLLALVGGLTPPAHSATYLLAEFVGEAELVAPLGYPCIGPGGTLDLGLCPHTKVDTPLTQSPLTLLTRIGSTHVTTTQIYPDLHHNKTTVAAIRSTTCVDEAVNVNKASKAPTHAGLCSFTIDTTPKPGGNTVAGNCGLSSGQVEVFFTDALGQTFHLDVHFIGLASKLVIEGHATKLTGTPRQVGLVVGVVEAVPPNKTLSGTGCNNKTARLFTIVGAIATVTTPN